MHILEAPEEKQLEDRRIGLSLKHIQDIRGIKNVAIIDICEADIRNSNITSKMSLLTNACNSLFVHPQNASTLSSFRPEPYIIVSRYSKARPFPAIPTFVSVDAGRSPLSISSAFALVDPL